MALRQFAFSMVILAVACGCTQPDVINPSTSQTIVNPDEVAKRLNILDQAFDPRDVCDDENLANLLIRYIQPSVAENFSSDTACATKFSTLAQRLRIKIAALGDLHARVEIGRAMDSTARPIVTACRGSSICDLIPIDAPLMPVSSSVEGALYAAIPSPIGQSRIVEISQIYAHSYEEIMSDALISRNLSHTRSGAIEGLANWALTRQVLDGRSLVGGFAKLRDLDSQSMFEVNLSYEPSQRFSFSPTEQARLASLNIQRDYGCLTFLESNNPNIGACMTEDGFGVIWIASFMDVAANNVTSFATKLASLSGFANSILLDLRGNTGGSTASVIDIACQLGDANILSRLSRRALHVNVWPEKLVLPSGNTVRSATLTSANNEDLVTAAPGWTVMDELDLPRTRVVGLLERLDLSSAACGQKRALSLERTFWTVITNGSEMSATETLLSLLKGSPRFRLLGRTSRGASGSPVRVTLPHTGIVLRLSMARQFDEQQGQMVIEQEGVAPDIEDPIDLADEFEARTRGTTIPSLIIRDAFQAMRNTYHD